MRRLRFNDEDDEAGGLTTTANGRDSESAPVVQSKHTDAGAAPMMHRVFQGVSSQSTTLVQQQQQQQDYPETIPADWFDIRNMWRPHAVGPPCRSLLEATLPVAASFTQLFECTASPVAATVAATVGTTLSTCHQEGAATANTGMEPAMYINNELFENPLPLLRKQMLIATLQSMSRQPDANVRSNELAVATLSVNQSGDFQIPRVAATDTGGHINTEVQTHRNTSIATSSDKSFFDKTATQQNSIRDLFYPQMLSAMPHPAIGVDSVRQVAPNVESTTSQSGSVGLEYHPGDAPEIFPMTLHRLLIDLEQSPKEDDIAVFIMPHGRSFIVKDTQRFETDIMPRYFPRMKRFASFQRQLNLYNFARLGGMGPARGAYCHEFFVRDHPTLACRMRRTKIKGLFKVPLEKRRNRQPSPQDG